MISGAIAGLGTITPASGFVAPWHGIVIGIVAGGLCYWACIKLKQKLGYDDLLDVFGVHGIGGATGTFWSACSRSPRSARSRADRRQHESTGDPALRRRRHPVVVRHPDPVILKVINFFVPLRVRDEDDGPASMSRNTVRRCSSSII